MSGDVTAPRNPVPHQELGELSGEGPGVLALLTQVASERALLATSINGTDPRR